MVPGFCENYMDTLDHKDNIDFQNRFGSSPLHYAAHQGNKEVVRGLLEKGAKRDIENEEGQTALDLAKHDDHFDVVDLLKN